MGQRRRDHKTLGCGVEGGRVEVGLEGGGRGRVVGGGGGAWREG